MKIHSNYIGADYSRRPRKYSRQPLVERELPISVRFSLDIYSKPDPKTGFRVLMVAVVVMTDSKKTRAETTIGKSLPVDPANWLTNEQRSKVDSDPVNEQVRAVRQKAEQIYREQATIAKPVAWSVRTELATGVRPAYSTVDGWHYPRPRHDRKSALQMFNRLTAESSLPDAYRAYVAHISAQKGTHAELSKITLGRWDRGLKLLNDYAAFMEADLPPVNRITVGWGKRFHSWLQSQTGGSLGRGNENKPVSAGQATRFIKKISNVLDWLIEDDIITDNPLCRVKWPHPPAKKVEYLEPQHVHQLLQTTAESSTESVARWWFCLMCVTGMDYPDAKAYVRNRSLYEVQGRNGWKIVGKRKKPPHNEYHLPRLDEVEILFAQHPKGPVAIAPQVLNRYTEEVEQELGIDWRITIKTARKTFGNLMLAAGVKIADVSLMMGHSSIVTTERHYIKVRAASIDRAMGEVKVSIDKLAGK